MVLRKYLKDKVKYHLSTQTNTLNWMTVKFWADQGVDRIILARELNIEEIYEIKQKVPNIELEVFVH
jgi:putative protease